MTLLRFATLFLSAAALAQAALEPRCGDCWCIHNGDGCPADESGIRGDTFDEADAMIMNSFQLTNDPDFLKLETEDGQECYPFADSLGPLDRHPESNLPKCAVPSSDSDAAVCAYKYDSEEDTCAGRSYEIMTYDSDQAAMDDNATVVHETPCGVCSSAQDNWAAIKNYDNLESDSVICATLYTVGNAEKRYGEMVVCFEKMGFSNPCASLWAHHAAASAIKCSIVCLPDIQGVTLLNGPAPQCEKEACLQCAADFQPDFDVIVGKTMTNSGIAERIAHPCADFYRVETTDPCVGTTIRGNVDTEPPTQSPGGSAGAGVTVTTSLALMSLAGLCVGA